MAAARRPRPAGALALFLAAALVGAISAMSAHAQERSGDPIRVPHQDVKPPPRSHAADSARGRHAIFGPRPGAGQNPAAFADEGKILPEPRRDAEKADSEPVHGRGGFAADRDTETKMDTFTSHDSELSYVTVFNPSVLPFKRMSALDTVKEYRGEYRLSAGSSALQDLPVGGKQRADRDLFWGSLVVELKPGRDVPIPSVAPDMRILSYEVEPRIKGITFSKDGADNYYVRTDETGADGLYRLVFLADANARYFGAAVPAGYQVRDVAREAPSDLIHPLPPRAQAMAERALQVLELHDRVELGKALDTLVNYFRQFQPQATPSRSGDDYWDLFINRAGVCRHRSFAFMVTANALRIPTRYVTNEAHAFVEVWVPEVHWLRVDLGGAALRMQVSNARDKSIHRPRAADPFPKPSQYANNYTRLEGDIRGLSPEQIAEAQAPVDEDDPSGGWGGSGDEDDERDPDAPRVGPGRKLPELPASAMRGKAPTSIAVAEVDPEGFKGDLVTVRGAVESRGSGVSGQRIDIYMAPAGQGGDDAVLVGHAVSANDGRFVANIELPRYLEPQDYEVYAATPGDAEHAPAVSE